MLLFETRCLRQLFNLMGTCGLSRGLKRWVWAAFASCLILMTGAAPAQVVLEGKGRSTENSAVTIRVLTQPIAAPRAVVLEIPALLTAPLKNDANGFQLANPDSPLTRLVMAANTEGIVHAMLDWPSDPTPLPRTWRQDPRHLRDIDVAIALLRQHFAGAPLFLGAYAEHASSVLHHVNRSTAHIDGVVLLSPNLGDMRLLQLSNRTPGFIVQVPTARCFATSDADAQELAERTGWNMLRVYYSVWGRPGLCGSTSQAALVNQVKPVATELAKWILGQTPAAVLGAAQMGRAGFEEVRMLKGSRGPVEVTLYRPPGSGPFPLLIWNHGDIVLGSPYLKGRRFREAELAHEFIDMGLAVAVVARPGVGRSEGYYRMGFSQGDADATYKGRVNAQEMLAVWPQLQELPWVDRQQLVVAGQSAGGFASVVAVSMQIPELVASMTFAGGRTDAPVSFRNDTMIRGFADAGKGANAPLLMVFAENDSRYTANTIRESHRAFVASGAKATLALYPARARDGHYLHTEPALWREDVRKFLQDVGLPITAQPAAPQRPTDSNPAPGP